MSDEQAEVIDRLQAATRQVTSGAKSPNDMIRSARFQEALRRVEAGHPSPNIDSD